MFYNSDCTIYHKGFDQTTRSDKYTRIYVKYCFWDSISGISKIKNGVENADEGLILIGVEQNQYDDEFPNQYINAIEYDKLPDTTGFWTITKGDTIVKGNIPVDVAFRDLEKLYPDVLKVTHKDEKLYGSLDMQHVEVGGK